MPIEEDPTHPRGRTMRNPAEEAIMREGVAEQISLAKKTAAQMLVDPMVLTPKRLTRLGEAGLQMLSAELRRSVISGDGGGLPSGAPVHSSRHAKDTSDVKALHRRTDAKSKGTTNFKKTRVTSKSSKLPQITSGNFVGWWTGLTEGATGFERNARLWGYTWGGVIFAACFVFLRINPQY